MCLEVVQTCWLSFHEHACVRARTRTHIHARSSTEGHIHGHPERRRGEGRKRATQEGPVKRGRRELPHGTAKVKAGEGPGEAGASRDHAGHSAWPFSRPVERALWASARLAPAGKDDARLPVTVPVARARDPQSRVGGEAVSWAQNRLDPEADNLAARHHQGRLSRGRECACASGSWETFKYRPAGACGLFPCRRRGARRQRPAVSRAGPEWC